MGFPGGSVVKTLPATQERWVQSLGGEDPLKEGMATHSSILVWRIPWTEEPGGLQSIGTQSQTRLKRQSIHTCKEGNGVYSQKVTVYILHDSASPK